MNLTYIWLALGLKQLAQTPVEPKIGMTWNVVHHRRTPHSHRGNTEYHGPLQIVDVQGDEVELLENNMYLKTVDWADFYMENLATPRSMKHDAHGGYMVHYYHGVKKIDEARLNRIRNPFVPQSFVW